MTNEVIYSPVEDKSKDIEKSPIWKNAWHLEEIDEKAKGKYANWWEYHVKFDGTKPVQVTKMKKAKF